MQAMINTQTTGQLATQFFENALNHAITFNSVEEAEEKFKAWSKGLIGFRSDDYDLSSLAIMQVAILPKKKSRFSHIHD